MYKYNSFKSMEACRDDNIKKSQKLGIGMAMHRQESACKATQVIYIVLYMIKYACREIPRGDVGYGCNL